jgi:3',5'-cyclic AMP phosphodiesterase CpdA
MATAVILHLSDTHRTLDEPVSNAEILHSLRGDIDRYGDFNVPVPNIIVVSGDVVQSADSEEYKEAAELIRGVADTLHIALDHVVLVPGNHDINWAISENSFVPREQPSSNVEKDLCFKYENAWICARSDDEYQNRLDPFRMFYKELFGREYPRARERQFDVFTFTDLGVAFAALNSCDTVDRWRRPGRIASAALGQAANALAAFQGTRVAVWHHDFDWHQEAPGQGLELDSMRFLSERAFDIGLCGHAHRSALNDAQTLRGLHLPVLAAGSLCAGKRERPQSVPRSYNIIALNGSSATVHVRIKKEKSTAWETEAIATGPGEFSSSYQVALGRAAPQRSEAGPGAVIPRRPTATKIPTPFGAITAKAADRTEVVSEYVWTGLTGALDTDMPQIVLGPRGSGKTALLLSLTFDGRAAAAAFRNSPATVLERLGLLCAMNVSDVTSFNSKSWIDPEELRSVFAGTLATLWAHEVITTLEHAIPWAQGHGIKVPTESEAMALVGRCLADVPPPASFSAMKSWVRSVRARLIGTLAFRDERRRKAALDSAMECPLARGVPSLLRDCTDELRPWEGFAKTRWVVLLDEVEYLNELQQDVAYEVLSQPTGSVSAKIATLPYAHARALSARKPNLAPGNDFTELVLTHSPGDEFQAAKTGATRTFSEVAASLWRARLEKVGITPAPDIRSIWVQTPYATVLAESHRAKGNGFPANPEAQQKYVLDAFLSQLSKTERSRAVELMHRSRRQFGDQYWRKYIQPFRYRLAESEHAEIPLLWGWRSMLRACDGNCRWFLKLADQCWSLYWSREGMRPLSASEQYAALCAWAESIYGVTRGLTASGEELKQIIDRVASQLRNRLIDGPSLTKERLSISAVGLAPAQAQAVAIGIAYGYIVPKLQQNIDAALGYPREDVELRLGFPVAVAKKLPLRSGTVLTIRDLRQVTFPWLTGS